MGKRYISLNLLQTSEDLIDGYGDLLRLLNDGGVNLEELILELIVQQPGIKAPAIAEGVQKSLRTTQWYQKMLSDGGRIEFRGAPQNGGYYQIADNK